MHAWVSADEDGWHYRDAGSSFGSYLGGGRHEEAIPLGEESVVLTLGSEGPELTIWVGGDEQVERGSLPAVGRHPLPSTGALVLGRAADADVRLHDLLVSRHHCEISPDGDRWRVRDLGSALGTYVNGEAGASSTLRAGDVLTLGATSFTVDRAVSFRFVNSRQPVSRPAGSR